MHRIAHRGRVGVDPENSIESVPAALGQADGLEIDVRLASDGIPILMHDATVDRTTDGSGRVEGLTSDELANCKVQGGLPVPCLSEYLEAAKTHRTPLVIIDLKDPTPQCLEATLDACEGFPTERLMFAVRGGDALAALRGLAPSARLASLGVTTENLEARLASGRASAAETLFVRHGDAAYQANRRVVAAIRAHGFKAGASTLSTLRTEQLARRDGCDVALVDLPLDPPEDPTDAGTPTAQRDR